MELRLGFGVFERVVKRYVGSENGFGLELASVLDGVLKVGIAICKLTNSRFPAHFRSLR